MSRNHSTFLFFFCMITNILIVIAISVTMEWLKKKANIRHVFISAFLDPLRNPRQCKIERFISVGP